MKAKTLTLLEMFQLHDILVKYVDKNYPEDAVAFIRHIVKNIQKNPSDYLHCIQSLSGLEPDEIVHEESIDCLTLFIEGLKINRYTDFMVAAKQLGLNYG